MTTRSTNAGPWLRICSSSSPVLLGHGCHATAIGAEHASRRLLRAARAPRGRGAARSRRAHPRTAPARPALAMAAISGLLMVTLTFEGIAEGTKLAGAGIAAPCW